MVAGLDDLEDNVHKGDSVKAEEIEKQTVVDRVDSNVAQMNDGEEDDERDCEVVSCNDWQVRNVDMEQLWDLDERPSQHVLHSLHQDTCPSEDECVSSGRQTSAERDHQTDVASEHNRRSGAVSDELTW